MSAETVANIERAEARLRSRLERYVENLQVEKDRFVEKFEMSPEYAIQWYSSSVVEAEVLGKAAQRILDAESHPESEFDLVTLTERIIEQFTRELMDQFGGSSTNPYSNANDMVSLKAKSKFIQNVKFVVGDVRRSQAEDQEQQELVDNVTDTTEYVLLETYSKLLNNMTKYNIEAREAKTKKAELAATTAANALNRQIGMLSELAEALEVPLQGRAS